MKLIFERLGALERGEIELSDLTIICGENNTGKTYVTYTLYCLLKSWRSLTRISLDTEMNELRQAGVVKINIRTKIVDDWPRIREKLLKKFLQEFPAMMGAREKLFS
ncbi:MAG: ATP-binding protein, partial [Gammaproteobacteria bacterium]|nr:ATP-binding protein [Gammaproteobacteria bacterium]